MKAPSAPSLVLRTVAALALFGTVALTGCTATDMAGPDMAPAETQTVEDAGDYRPTPSNGAQVNGGDEGGGTDHTASHNTMPREDE